MHRKMFLEVIMDDPMELVKQTIKDLSVLEYDLNKLTEAVRNLENAIRILNYNRAIVSRFGPSRN
jgi:hypothetical protein